MENLIKLAQKWKIFSLAVGMLHGKTLFTGTNPITLDLAILKGCQTHPFPETEVPECSHVPGMPGARGCCQVHWCCCPSRGNIFHFSCRTAISTILKKPQMGETGTFAISGRGCRGDGHSPITL